MFTLDDKVVLQFSGGKDSLACLYLLEEYWPRLTVVWCDTGDALPETHLQMEEVAKLVHTFIRAPSDQPGNIARNGPPADVVGVWQTPTGRLLRVAQTMPPVQAPFDCCAENIWRPLDRASRGAGATIIVRGQRNSEVLKSPVRSGYIENGVKYVFPLEEWTEAQVVEFLDNRGIALPKHYAYFNSSLDCGHCTAYLSENVGRMRYLRAHHLAVHEEVQRRLGQIMYVAASELQHVTDAIKE